MPSSPSQIKDVEKPALFAVSVSVPGKKQNKLSNEIPQK